MGKFHGSAQNSAFCAKLVPSDNDDDMASFDHLFYLALST